MGELQSGRADIAAFPLTLVPGRPNDIDITYSYISGEQQTAGARACVPSRQVMHPATPERNPCMPLPLVVI